MWNCPTCGTNNEEEGRFCVGCGQPRPEPTTQVATEQVWQLPDLPQQPIRRQEPRRRTPVWPWLVVGGLALAAAVLVLLVAVRKPDPLPEPSGPSDPSVIVVTPEPTVGAEPAAPVTVSAREDLRLYLPVVENAIEENRVFAQMDLFAGGMLADLDNDGVRELILVYPGYVGEWNAEAVVCVYSQRDGKVVTLLERQGFAGLAVDPGYYAGVAERDGKTYFLLRWTNADQFGSVERIYLYDPEDFSLAFELSCTKEKGRAQDCQCNGSAWTEAEYNRFVAGLETRALIGELNYGATTKDAETMTEGLGCCAVTWVDNSTAARRKIIRGDAGELEDVKALVGGGEAAPVTTAPTGPAILTDASQVSEAGERQLRDTLDGIVASNVRTTWNTEEHLTRSEYVGYYLLTAKDPNAGVQNRLILVCRNDVSIVIPKEKIDKSLSYYYSIEYCNVTVNPDGTLNLGGYQEPGTNVKADIYRHNYYYFGHETAEGVYNYWVKPHTGGYEVTRAGSVW